MENDNGALPRKKLKSAVVDKLPHKFKKYDLPPYHRARSFTVFSLKFWNILGEFQFNFSLQMLHLKTFNFSNKKKNWNSEGNSGGSHISQYLNNFLSRDNVNVQ